MLFSSRIGLIGIGFVLYALVSAIAAPPPTPARPVEDTVHGVKMSDAFRWLEGDAEGNVTDEVASWTDAQNGYTRQVLDNLPGRAALEARLRQLMEVGSVSAPVMRGDRYFYRERKGTQNQSVVYMRVGARGEPKLLLDPNTLDARGLVTVAWVEPSENGKLLAFGMYRAGDENATLYLLDIDTGTWLADEIPGKVGTVSWLPDSSGFYYSRLADVKNPYSRQIKFHKIGTHHRQDPLLFRQYTKEENEKLATTWGPFFGASKDGRWGMLGYYTSTKDNDLWVIDLERWTKTREFVRTEILVGQTGTAQGLFVGDTMFLQTTFEAPNGRVVAVDLRKPERKNWKVIIPERKDAVLQGLDLAKGQLVATYLASAYSQIELFAFDGKSLGKVALPGIGTGSISTEDDRTEAFLSYASFNEPSSIYQIELGTPKSELWERPEVPVDPSIAEVKQVFYTSKDGTRVSMFVVHKKGLVLNGDNPTLLNGYGGFNNSETPRFMPVLFPWFEAGGVFALPNLRGGGEYGDTWHEAGMLEHKQNVFDDFIAAAEWLIANKYTRSERLAISGGSNGGLLTGAFLTQRPELCKAVICAVPLLDMLRYQNFLMARYWVPEYGTAEDPVQFAFLKEYSPYHCVKAGVKYPATLLTAGENDTRVHPLHARKMAALLQSSTTANPTTEPVLLWVDREAGHGQGKPLHLRIRDAADQRMFLMWQLGMLPGGS
ncbi:MAG: prolyl oligopeptidase family serine peptidase [Planctomycetota bacterium]